MVRRKIEIKPIEDKAKRHTTFTKRRQGLFKKTEELCQMCDAEAAVIAFSKVGNGYAMGHPHFETVLNRYIANKNNDNDVEEDELLEKVILPSLTDVEKKFSDAIKEEKPAWDVVMEGLGYDELSELEVGLKKIKSVVAARLRRMAASEVDYKTALSI